MNFIFQSEQSLLMEYKSDTQEIPLEKRDFICHAERTNVIKDRYQPSMGEYQPTYYDSYTYSLHTQPCDLIHPRTYTDSKFHDFRD